MSEAVSSPPPKRGRRKEARPGELLDAALDLFVEKGFAATKVDEVAARAGVSKGTLFLYFPSKEELFKAVVRENIAGRFAEWGQTLADATGSSSEMLRYAFAQWWEHVGSTKAGGLAKLMFSEANNFPDITEFYRREVVVPGQELIAHILQRGMDSGEFRRVDMDYAIYLVQAPLMYLLLMQPTKSLCVANPENFSPEEYIRTQVDNLVLGLSREPA